MRRGFGLLWLLTAASCSRSGGESAPARVDPAPSTASPHPEAPPSSSSSAEPVASSSAVPRASAAAIREVRTIEPKALLAALPSPGGHPSAGFLGPVDRALDGAWVQRLATGRVAQVEWHGGGVSLTFRVRFADGKKALFKPEQTLSGSNHRAEIAAYHLDRMLGFGRVAVVVGRALPVALLRDAVTDPKISDRVARELVADGDKITGALIAWHTAPLASAEPKPGWRASMSGKIPLDDAIKPRAGELSDLMVFDFLQDNTDRWSGGNVLSLGKDGPLIFLDNASSLLPSRAKSGASLARELAQVCRFRRRTAAALRGDRDLAGELAESVARDPAGTKLEARVVEALRERVRHLRRHLAACERDVGEAMWLDE